MNKKSRLIIIIGLTCLISAFCGGCNINTASSNSGTSSSVVNTAKSNNIDLSSGSTKITASGTYQISGELKEGSLIVDVNKDVDKGTVCLVFNNITISSSSASPIHIVEAKNVLIQLPEGSSSTVIQTGNTTDTTAALFSKADLTIEGTGSLQVQGDFNDGITSKDSLVINGGNISVKAVADGIVGKDDVTINDGTISITAGKDGIRSTNDTDANMGNILIKNGDISITAANDGIQAVTALTIENGTFNITTGGGFSEDAFENARAADPDWMNIPGLGRGNKNQGDINMGNIQPPQAPSETPSDTSPTLTLTPTNASSATTQSQDTATTNTSDSKKGIKATGNITINNGTFQISSYDDSIHSNGNLSINNGTFNISSGDDAIHADLLLEISDGILTIDNCYEGLEGKNINLSGGTCTLKSNDDSINVNDNAGTLDISGGEYHISPGGDGLDSNGNITMSAGTLTIDGPTNQGDGSLDFDGSFNITGGTLITAGSSMMSMTPAATSPQPSLQILYSTQQSAGTKLSIKDTGGKEIASFTPQNNYSGAIISAPNLTSGQDYTLLANDTEIVTFTLSQGITTINENGITTAPAAMGQGGKRFNQQQPPDMNNVPNIANTPPTAPQ